MTSFNDELQEMYQGEVIGEALFDRMLTFYDDPQARYRVAVMLQLETETKARLRPPMLELGLDIVELAESRAAGLGLAESLRGEPWDAAMARLGEALKPYVARYRDIAAGAPPAHRALAQSMVVHEESLLEFTELECAGRPRESLAAITRQLVFPLPAP